MPISGRTPSQIVLDGQDIPSTAANLSTESTLATTTGDAGAGPGTTTTDMYVRNKVINVQFANKDTRFENLVYAITSGYASNSDCPYRTDAEFAARACQLARSIAYEMTKYGSV